MRVNDLLNIDGIKLSEPITDFDVTGITLDSRDVKPGNIFFSIKGLKTDGRKFISQAKEKGAGLIIAETKYKDEYRGFKEIVFADNIRKSMAEISSRYYDNPSKKLKIVGITGTNGKTTISFIIKKILEEAGYKCGLIGTINYMVGNDSTSTARLTTPDSIELYKLLSDMVNNGVDYCIMEVSSIALINYRVYGIEFDSAIFTNLTSEHMDLHLNMENYFNAKKLLFDNLESGKTAISNSDDSYGIEMLKDCKGDKKYYSIESNSDLKAEDIDIRLNGLKFKISYNNQKYEIVSSLTGRFNIYNLLSGILFGISKSIPMENIQSAVENFQAAKGRFNRTMLPNGACAIVDYSHTSDSLKNAIEAAIDVRNSDGSDGKVITVFGCGGDRDKTKRPVMGKIATELSDYVIITSDNPRTEDPLSIINDIVAGVGDKRNYTIDVNRETAISKSIEISRKGDIVLICGKGHETYQEINGIKTHFDDQEIIIKNFELAKN